MSLFSYWLTAAASLAAAPVMAQATAPAAAPAAAPASPTAPSATGNTKIVVHQKGSGLPIGKAEITINSQKTLTGPDGSASLDVPQSGEGNLVLSRQGFETLEVPFASLRPPG